jgi:hypothetical protein
MGGNSNLQSTTINAPDNQNADLPMLSPYAGNGSWASMVRPRIFTFINVVGFCSRGKVFEEDDFGTHIYLNPST